MQTRLPDIYRTVQRDHHVAHTVVVVPSLSLDVAELHKITGVIHYEERLLFSLMLLRDPRTHVIFVTSEHLPKAIVDYYLNLLSGVPYSHAHSRLHLFDCYDSSDIPLTQKLLNRPRLLRRIRDKIQPTSIAELICYNASALERTLSVQLEIPLYGNDPALSDLGTKSGCREILREAGVQTPAGYERLRDANDVAAALAALAAKRPGLRRAVVKLNEGFSGEGNAVFCFDHVTGRSDAARRKEITEALPRMRFEADEESWDRYEAKFAEMGGVIEEYVEGNAKRSPSAQSRVTAIGRPEPVSTHDQVLTGPSGQIFSGCVFPADPAYRLEIQEAGMRVAEVLARKGVLGRFSTDFVSHTTPEGEYRHYAIEINLRKGGTTHPYLTLRLLTDGSYIPETGEFASPSGTLKYYYATDNLKSPHYAGLLPEDLMGIAVEHRLHFDHTTEEGTVFHMIGALSEFGKIGYVSIADGPARASELARRTEYALDKATENTQDPGRRAPKANGAVLHREP